MHKVQGYGKIRSVSGDDKSSPRFTSVFPSIHITTEGGADITDNDTNITSYRVKPPGSSQSPFVSLSTTAVIHNRGSFSNSAGIVKHQFSVEFPSKLAIPDLGITSAMAMDDFALSACVFDGTFLRNSLSYQLNRDMGLWAPVTCPVELVINGVYWGAYIHAETPKKATTRLNVTKNDATTAVNNGYIFQGKGHGHVGDPYKDLTKFYWQSPRFPGNNIFSIEYPKNANQTSAHRTFISNRLEAAEVVLYGTDFKHPTLGWRSQFEETSLAKYILINLIENAEDAFAESCYFHIDTPNGLIKTGCDWDKDGAFGGSTHAFLAATTGNILAGADPIGDRINWFYRFWEDETLRATVGDLYASLRPTVFATARIHAMIDAHMVLFKKGTEGREELRWKSFTEPALAWHPAYGTIENEINNHVKPWIAARLANLDTELA